jgi:hypothetical protein
VSIDLENSRCRARSTDTTAITAAARASRMRWRTRNTAIRLAIGEPKGSWGERQGGEEADKIGDSLGRRGVGKKPSERAQSYRPCQDGRAFCRDHRDADHQDCSFLPGAGRQRRPDGQPQERVHRPFGAAANPPLCRHLRPVRGGRDALTHACHRSYKPAVFPAPRPFSDPSERLECSTPASRRHHLHAAPACPRVSAAAARGCWWWPSPA